MKRNYWAEFAITMVTIVGAWYFQEERPAPVPAFWYYAGIQAHKFGNYAGRQYVSAIERTYL